MSTSSESSSSSNPQINFTKRYSDRNIKNEYQIVNINSIKMSEIELIFLDNCEKCNKKHEIKNRIWYSKYEINLCEICFIESFIESLTEEKCKGHQRKLCDNIKCKKCYLKSFASHEKSKYWSYKNKLTVRNVFRGGDKKYIFNCGCGHKFETLVRHISSNKWCPYCSTPPQKLCNDKNCISCFNKSFASHEKSKYWSKKNKTTPREEFKNSNKFFIFDCICGHEFSDKLNHIFCKRWCPYCASPSRILCTNLTCDLCFNKSFASHMKKVNTGVRKIKQLQEKNLEIVEKSLYSIVNRDMNLIEEQVI